MTRLGIEPQYPGHMNCNRDITHPNTEQTHTKKEINVEIIKKIMSELKTT